MKSQHNRGKGFTLTELLVGMSIVGTLVAMLIPALSPSKENARMSKCRANIKSGIQSINALNVDYADDSGVAYQSWSNAKQQEIKERFWVEAMGPQELRHPDAYIGAPYFRTPLMNCPDTREESVTQNSFRFLMDMSDLVPGKYVGGERLIFLSNYGLKDHAAFTPDIYSLMTPPSKLDVITECLSWDAENFEPLDDVINGRPIRRVWGANHAKLIKSDDLYGNIGYADGHVEWKKTNRNGDGEIE